MSQYDHHQQLADAFLTRRDFLTRCGMGFGSLAMGGLLGKAGANPLSGKPPQFGGKAKRVIHIFLNGGPSHVDTFDRKPLLNKHHGKKLPMDHLTTERRTGAGFGSPYEFHRYGKSGIEVSELFKHTAEHVDDMCFVRSMHADVPNHEPSLMLMNTGDSQLVRPSLGSWVNYGLGSENENLPGFITMCPGGYPIKGAQNWQNAFLPGAYQATYIDSKHEEIDRLIAHIKNKSIPDKSQREQLDLLSKLNRAHAAKRQEDSALESRIHSFELAYRMQIEATDAFDITMEPASVRERYGDTLQGKQLLMARRLVERGVRFVQLWHGAGQPWDNHDDIEVNHRNLATQCDRGIAALLTDLKERGLLDETLVVCGGEFGRTPTVELPTPGSNAGKINGRDHNHYGFTTWLAGGGVKGGHVHGATDDFGFAAVDKPVHVHDLHATILHLLGFDHEEFTYRYAGRDFRLTDVHGNVVRDIIA